MIRRVQTLVADCDMCKRVSKEFKTTSYRASEEHELDAHAFLKQLPFGWGIWRTGGWGMTGYTRDQLLCSDCVEKAKAENYGKLTMSERPVLDALSDVTDSITQ